MNRSRVLIFAALVFILVTAAVVAFILINQAGVALPVTDDDLPPGGESILYVIVPLVFLITIGSMIPFVRLLFPTRIKNGEAARATILKVWDTGTTINDNPQIGLELEVVTKEGRRFTGQAKTIVSRLNVALVQPGVSAEVLYDPQNLKRIQVLQIDVGSADGGGQDAESRLKQLASLRDKGLISEDEYQRKREEIIRSI